MPNKYPVNPVKVPPASFKVRRQMSGGIPRAQARVSRKTATILRLQDRTSNQLFRLAAASGALHKKALKKGDRQLANTALTIASSAGRLARAMWKDYRTIASATGRLLGKKFPGGPVRSPNVHISARGSRTQPQASRKKGPVNIVDPSSLGKAMANLKAARRELFRFAEQPRGRY